ncbi:hypothetical protein RB653_009116 [Dictyostelium firmibasis]|uniref:Uncharacterized protein n=1 Tax=Dictyostelium firmibasis TaxID=79012 RepID=A0AAN7U1T1_9MYCE
MVYCNNDENEILFWKVFKNVVVRNLIFQVMSEQVIEYDDIKKNYIGNRVKFSNMISLGWMSKKKLWNILKDKLISNQYIRINKKELTKFFKYCNEDLESIKLLYALKRDEINLIINPINESIENENQLALKYFIYYIDEKTGEKLPINYKEFSGLFNIEFYIKNESIVDIIYLGLKERNQEKDIKFLKTQLLSTLLFFIEDKQRFRLISNIFEKYPELYPKKNESISKKIKVTPLENVLKLDSIHRDLQYKLFLGDCINFKNKFPNMLIANNYKNYSFDDFLFLYKCIYKFNNLLVSAEKVDIIVTEMIKSQHSISEKEKLKFLKLNLAIELSCDSFNYLYLCEYDDNFDSLENDSVASYVFSMFSIKGLNYLIEISYKSHGTSIFFPNDQVVINNPNLFIQFTKVYFENYNHYSMGYNGWMYAISSIINNCPLEVLKEIIETVADFPLKVISKLLYSFQVDCPSKMLKIIGLLKSANENNYDENCGGHSHDVEYNEYSSFFSMKLFKFSNYLIGLNNYFKINSISQFNDLKVFNDLLFPFNLSQNCEVDEDNKLKSQFYDSLSVHINSVDLLKQAIINYPLAPKELFSKYLVKLLNNFDIETVKEIMKIIKVAKIDGNNKTFSFNQDIPLETRYKRIEEILNYLNEINISNMFTGNGISSFFIGLFNSFSNYNELIESCQSIKKFSFSLHQNQSSIITCEILFNQSIQFNDRLKIIKYILNEISTFTLLDYFPKDSNQEFVIFDYKTDRIVQYEINPCDIIEIIELLLKKVDKKGIIECTVKEMVQILYNLFVQSKDVSLQHIESVMELCETNSIELDVGFFHSFYFFNSKSFKLSNLILDDPNTFTRDTMFSKKNLYGKHFYFYNKHYTFDFIKNSSFEFLVNELMEMYHQPKEDSMGVTYLLKIGEPKLAISLLKNIGSSFSNSNPADQSGVIIKYLFKVSCYRIPFQEVIFKLVNLNLEEFSINILLKQSILLERVDITDFIISNYGKDINNLMFCYYNINPFVKNCKLICKYLFENHKDVLLNSLKIDKEFVETIKNQGLIEMHDLILKYKY